MCECENCPRASALKIKANRRKLWEVDARRMCTVIGTCLSVADLRRLADRTKLSFPGGPPSEYQLHGAIVQLARESGLTARLTHKLLERKFAAQVARFSRVGCAGALERLWQEAKAKGEVPGACWALATHPGLPERLADTVFGEIHMMSHLAGAAFRAELRRQGEAERRIAELEAELAAGRAGAARAMADRQRRIHALEAETARLSDEGRRRQALEVRLAAYESGEAQAQLRLRLGEATRAQSRAELQRDAAEARAVILEARTQRLNAEVAELSAELAELRAAYQPAPANDPVPDLVGRCVLYVGGRDRLMPHLQAAARKCNGELVHHDGGLSEGAAKLDSALDRADVVVCPVDCVSHDAVDRIKQACRRCDKPFVPLRGMGISAFLRGLQTIAAAE